MTMDFRMSRAHRIARVEGRLTAQRGQFLDNDAIQRVAPSVFAETAHDSRSERFMPIPTFRVIDAMRKEGFGVTEVMQSRSRDASKREFTKHLLRLSRLDYRPSAERRVGDLIPQVTLVNANDGSSAYHLLVGMMRLICLNGLMVDGGKLDAVRVSHTGNVVDRVIEGSYRVLDESTQAMDRAEEWAGITLDGRAQLAFAEGARVIRWGDSDGNVSPSGRAVSNDQILRPRRNEDRRNDLWTVFNRTQENLIRGGMHGVTTDDQNRQRRYTSRAINGIDGDTKVNRALWVLADTLGQQFVPAAA